MFKDVQKKLTILYTALTGMILMTLLAGIFMWNITSREQSESAAFQNLWLSLSSRIQMDSILSDSYLAQTEAASRAIIHVEENGSPLLYSGSWTPPTERERLIGLGIQKAAEENIESTRPPVSSSVEQSSVFRVMGDGGDSYYGRMCVMAPDRRPGAGAKSLLLLAYITPRSTLVLKSLPLFLLFSAAGIVCIFFVSWHLTGRALDPARDSVKKQAEFIAAASHELRSPLAVIRSAVSVLKDMGGPSGQDSCALLSSVDKECGRMARLVSDMLLLASTDAGTWTLKKQSVETDTLLIETYESFLPLCGEKHLKLSLELPADPLPPVMADRQRLEQVLSILLDNALSYSPEGGEITLKASVTQGGRHANAGDKKLIIEVCDRGQGIPDHLKQHIFDRFYRGDASRNDKKHFGLGLSIARELVELHGGSITVLDNPGGGSRFVVQL